MNEHAQRRAGRLPAKLAIVLILDSAGEKTEVQAQSSDLSQYGAGLYAEADLQAGQLVEVVPSEGLKYAVRRTSELPVVTSPREIRSWRSACGSSWPHSFANRNTVS